MYYFYRFENIKTLPGKRSYHQFNPLNSILIGAKRISDQLDYTVTYDFRVNHLTNSKKPSQLTYLSIGEYVSCIYDNNWYIGMIQEVCAE